MRPRYYCDHCNKGSGSPSAMKRHESGCTMNPQRVCRMCALEEEVGGEGQGPARDELLMIMDADGFPAMAEAAHHCPACILSALRTRNMPWGEDNGPCHVAGPEDGRNEWSYAKAKEAWWADYNADMQQHENPY